MIRQKRRGPVTVLQTCPVRGLACTTDARRLNAAVMYAVETYRQQVLADSVQKLREDAASAPSDGLDIRKLDDGD